MKWNEFLDKLKVGKDTGKAKKISVPVLAALIFSGAFDSMITQDMYLPEDGSTPTVRIYTVMFEQLKKVMKSKASLPKMKKGEYIGLDQVDNLLKLSMWRTQRSPIVKRIDFTPFLAAPLKTWGYESVNKEGSIFKFIRGADPKNGKQQVLGTPEWRALFSDKTRLSLFDSRQLMLYGIVTEARILKYGENKEKERLVFKIFTGYELTDEIVVWPSRQTGQLSEVLKHEVQDGKTCFCLVKPSLWNNKPTATIISFQRLSL